MSYGSGSQAQDAMAVIAGWMGNDYGVRVKYHTGATVCADVKNKVIQVPRLACASGVKNDDLMVLRGRVYHESGHIAFTDLSEDDTPKKKALFECLNAVEDRRIERKLVEKHEGAGPVLQWNIDKANKKIASKIAEHGEPASPLWEGLAAMGLMVEGRTPAWQLSDKARAYVDAGYDAFSKIRNADTVHDSLAVANEVYEILKKVNKEMKQEQEQQSGGQGDGDEQSEQDGDKKPGKSGKSKKDDAAGDEDGKDESAGKGSGDEDGEDQEDQNAGSAGDDFDEESDGKDSEDGEDSEDGDGKGQDGKSQSGETCGDESDCQGDSGGDDFDDEDGDESDVTTKPSQEAGGGDYTPNDLGKADGYEQEPEDQLEQESTGENGLEAVMSEVAKDIIDSIEDNGEIYLSDRSKDKHVMAKGDDSTRMQFVKTRESVAAEVGSIVRAVEQALRAMARCRKMSYQRNGKLDMRRLPQLAKGLSKEVFYKTRTGLKIDTVVSIVVDESGSMCDQVKEVRQVVVMLGETLERIGVEFEVIGSTTTGSYYGREKLNGFDRVNPIRYAHYKGLGESWLAVRDRVMKLSAHVNNVDGEVLEYVSNGLMQRPEKRKIVFMLSDGEPCAGHGNNSVMCRNLKAVVKRVRNVGIEVYGFGVDTEAPKHFYGDKWFVGLRKGALGQGLAQKLAGVLTLGRLGAK